MAGDEVVQVYVTGKNFVVPVPLRSLKAFKRVHLSPGETKTINFTLTDDAFSFIGEDGKKAVVSGDYEIAIGGGQPDVKLKTTSNVLKNTIRMLNN